MRKFDYYSDWCEYAYNDSNGPAFDADIRNRYRGVELSGKKKIASGGVPLLVENDTAYVNDLNENMLIFGETGCKKTRSVIAPMIVTAAGAGESAVVTDVKGELSSNKKLRGWLREMGVKTVVIDFRTFGADGVNILEKPYNMYRKGEKDRALAEVSRLISSMSAKYKNEEDPFWINSAVMYLQAVIEMMFVMGVQTGFHDSVNMLTLSYLANNKTTEELRDVMKEFPSSFEAMLSPMSYSMLKSVVMNPAEKTLGCILNFVQTMLRPFIMEPKLAEMLSRSTFSIADVYEKPTFIFLVVPDETSAYDSIAGLIIDTFYSELVGTYSEKYMNRSESPCRINFICDEFCNLRVNDMKAKISASRGRNMRWYLVCQSKDQLEKTYGDESGTIIGNCRNTLFLQSCDKNLIDYISGLCGKTTVTENGVTENMVTDRMLRSLRKEKAYKEALFIDGNVFYFAKLPDIDSYNFLARYTNEHVSEVSRVESEDINIFTMNTVYGVFSY